MIVGAFLRVSPGHLLTDKLWEALQTLSGGEGKSESLVQFDPELFGSLGLQSTLGWKNCPGRNKHKI